MTNSWKIVVFLAIQSLIFISFCFILYFPFYSLLFYSTEYRIISSGFVVLCFFYILTIFPLILLWLKGKKWVSYLLSLLNVIIFLFSGYLVFIVIIFNISNPYATAQFFLFGTIGFSIVCLLSVITIPFILGCNNLLRELSSKIRHIVFISTLILEFIVIFFCVIIILKPVGYSCLLGGGHIDNAKVEFECIYPTSDGGKVCTDSNQCEGYCVPSLDKEKITSGTCTLEKGGKVTPCTIQMLNGKYAGGNCPMRVD